MKKNWLFLILFISIQIFAQQEIQFIDNVPESFKTKYNQSTHEYNPLHVGDFWQYTYTEITGEEHITEWEIVSDTLVGNKKYFKKNNLYKTTWERNDSVKNATYLLDVDDLDTNGITDEELLLDSLDVPNYSEYISYRLIAKNYLPDTPAIALVEDSSWAIIFGDTVMTRRVQYLAAFTTQIIADKFGVIWSMPDGPPSIINAAIIDGIKYGVVVSVDDDYNSEIPNKFALSQNYPNPFNPSTQIKYQIPKEGYVTLKVYDILGREVVTLVNQKQGIGRYEATFSTTGGASQISSGVYIYRLTVRSGLDGNFAASKKMILLK